MWATRYVMCWTTEITLRNYATWSWIHYLVVIYILGPVLCMSVCGDFITYLTVHPFRIAGFLQFRLKTSVCLASTQQVKSFQLRLNIWVCICVCEALLTRRKRYTDPIVITMVTYIVYNEPVLLMKVKGHLNQHVSIRSGLSVTSMSYTFSMESVKLLHQIFTF